MRILLITIDFPLPADAGGVTRALGISEALVRRGHDVHVLAKLRPGQSDPNLPSTLSARLGGAPVEAFAPGQLPPPAGVLRSAGRWTWAIGTATPPWVWTAYSRRLAQRAVSLAPSFDVALLLDDHAHAFAPVIHGLIPTVLDKQNVLAASWNATNHWSRGARPTGRQRAQQALAFALVRRWEHRVLTAASAVVVTSADEAERARTHHGLDVEWMPSAIDLPAITADPRQAKPRVAWLGDHRYHANADGLERFIAEAWRPLGERGLRLQVIGRDPSPKVLAMARELPGIDVLGYVDDLSAVLAESAAAVVPLWAGAGIKMKTLALMGAGLPVASTPIGLEGIAAQDGRDVRVAAQPSGLAAALRDFVVDRERASAIGVSARARIAADHTWNAVVPRLEDVLRRIARSR